ncbi:hypothetical protein BHE74_00039777, partial [Ensete ventricosum]
DISNVLEKIDTEIHKVTIQVAQGKRHSLSRYNAMWNKPRPESATTDEESASKLSTAAQKKNFYHQLASTAESGWDFSSRWMRLHGPKVEKVLKSLQNSGLLQPAGIATSLTNTGQQWDFPNGWAPLQHMIVEGLANSGSEEARSLAEDIAVRWIRTNYVAYKKTGAMHEKYDVEACGKIGGGGEYKPQVMNPFKLFLLTNNLIYLKIFSISFGFCIEIM